MLRVSSGDLMKRQQRKIRISISLIISPPEGKRKPDVIRSTIESKPNEQSVTWFSIDSLVDSIIILNHGVVNVLYQ